MKIRNGFVSNSSSSSFVVAWPRNSIREWNWNMHKFLFGSNRNKIFRSLNGDKRYTVSSYFICAVIHHLIELQVDMDYVSINENEDELVDTKELERMKEIFNLFHSEEWSFPDDIELKSKYDKIEEELSEAHYKLHGDLEPWYFSPSYKTYLDERSKAGLIPAAKKMKAFIAKNPDSTFYIFKLGSDVSWLGDILEQMNPFKKTNYKIFNHH